MALRIDVYHHFEGDVLVEGTGVDRKLNRILEIVQGLKKEEKIMIQEMQALTDKVTEIEGVEASATATIQAIVAKLNELAQNATDLADAKAQATALSQSLTDATAPLAAAIAANPLAPLAP